MVDLSGTFFWTFYFLWSVVQVDVCQAYDWAHQAQWSIIHSIELPTHITSVTPWINFSSGFFLIFLCPCFQW